jgi:8-oxo-dGTP diphosphatase
MKNKKVIFVFSGLITNSDKKILLVKRKEKELPQAHNKWELPGGKLDFGETIEEALKREIYEETGYQVATIKMLPKPFYSLWHYSKFDQYTVIFCFVCRLKNGMRTVRKDHHVEKIGWFSQNQIKRLSLLPGVTFFIEQFLNPKNNSQDY